MKKEEIRHDPVRENIVKGIQYIKDNQNTVLKIFVVLVILVFAFSYYNNIGKGNIGNASKIAGLAQNSFINGDIDEAMVKFERVLDDYPSTSGSVQSLVYLLNDALTIEDYETVSILISQYKDGISRIDDPIIKSAIFKIQGDIELANGNTDNALSYYKKAEKISKDNVSKVKFKLDIISALINQGDYNEAQNILENILDIKDVGYNEKNRTEELLAFVNYKLGT